MTNNIFAQAANNSASMTFTENGHPVASTTGDKLLDLYGQVGALRHQDEDRIRKLFDNAIQEDKLLAAKIMFYARDARGGTGERWLFRRLLRYAADKYPEMVRPNLRLVAEYGRWDDLYCLVETSLEDEMFEVIGHQLSMDVSAAMRDEPVSLLAKWLPSCNASSKDTQELGRLTCKKLGIKESLYRKTLSKLRARIKIVEAQMSANKWQDIQYDKIPSRAGMIYRKAFDRHDSERYADYISSVMKGEKKINAKMNTPQDLVHACYGHPEDPTIEAMWKNLPDYVNSEENVLCMVDVSGSMYGRPIEVSTGLGMYFAQHNKGAFHNLFLTFESSPRFCSLDDNLSFHDNLSNVFRAPWGGSTNLNLACESMLQFAVQNKVPQKDMPTRLLIISDMEIDEAAGIGHYGWRSNLSSSEALHINELKQMYAEHGYSVPQVIYWNVDSRDNHFHTKSDIPGTMLASGSSPAVFEAVMAMKDLEVTPYSAMLEVLNSERYAPITVSRA